MKKLLSVRSTLTVLLVCSIIFAAHSMYHKVKYWGFEMFPNKLTDVWTVEANITFEPTGDPIKISLATPSNSQQLKILDESIVAPGYKIQKISNGVNKVELTAKNKSELQNLYYRIMIYDTENAKGKVKATAPKKPKKPNLEPQQEINIKEIIKLAEKETGDPVQQVINLLNKVPLDAVVMDFLPNKKSQRETVETINTILAYKGISSAAVRGIKLEEDKKSFSPDYMIEAYTGENWRIYNIKDAKKGIPDNFVIFQRGGESLLDVEGGVNSGIKFSVIKSVTSSFSMSAHRAKLKGQKRFEYSIYNLPLAEQNTLKWLMIFPLAILVVVVMRNVIGVRTMGTFTPMLIAMALVEAGFWQGIIVFTFMVGMGLLIRALLSRLNLLLVPRISAVTVFVILIIQALTIFGYKFDLQTALSSAFFPIIIMAWIIERASITWEEDGAKNALQEVFWTLVVAIVTYFIISNEYVRYITFAFNEVNVVILIMIMMLGTYTGYRLTELKRFVPIINKG